MKDRIILHCDCNNYFASVETIYRPELRDVPMAVCGDPASRHGIILAKNERAKKYGVQTAETIYQALRKCPSLTLISPTRHLYGEYCRRINAIYAQYTDQVEAFSIDESWLDVTASEHLFGSGEQIADELRRRVREELGLTISVGVSFNKVFAKLGSDYKKPDATTVITRENYPDILFPLPVESMLFVGRTTAQALRRFYVRTIGDLAALPRERAVSLLGEASGDMLWRYANGLDDSPVRRQGEVDPVKSVSNSTTFSHDLTGAEEIRTGLMLLCDSVGGRLREQQLYATTVQVQIRNPALKTICRQKKLVRPSSMTSELYQCALTLVEASWNPGAPIRMLGVGASGLVDSDESAQISLFEDETAGIRERRKRLETTVDELRRRFGHDVLLPGRTQFAFFTAALAAFSSCRQSGGNALDDPQDATF